VKDLVKMCALCERTIPYHQVVCKTHMPELEMYHNETWFIELAAAQQKQYEIDLAELKLITFGIQKEPKRYITDTKVRGKRLDYMTRRKIYAMKAQGLGARKIAKALNLSFNTVNSVLKRSAKVQNRKNLHNDTF
jgi:DNA-binding NarL/FixJ family response regulator